MGVHKEKRSVARTEDRILNLSSRDGHQKNREKNHLHGKFNPFIRGENFHQPVCHAISVLGKMSSFSLNENELIAFIFKLKKISNKILLLLLWIVFISIYLKIPFSLNLKVLTGRNLAILANVTKCTISKFDMRSRRQNKINISDRKIM